MFTEFDYREMLKRVNKKYVVARFGNLFGENPMSSVPHVLWRHDIDMSPHRAAAIAVIEEEEGIESTFFIHLHSVFYNPLEESVAQKINRIIECGHSLGLHYDTSFYKSIYPKDLLTESIKYESEFLWDVFGIRPMAISFHNPSFLKSGIPHEKIVEKMVNADSDYIRENYMFCSDSNCTWRYGTVDDLMIRDYKRIHILTHPEWWTETEMPHLEKVKRCISGRVNHEKKYYKDIMAKVYIDK